MLLGGALASRRPLRKAWLVMSPTQALKQTLTSFLRTFVFPRHLVPAISQLGALEPRIERMWLDTEAGPVEGWLLCGDGVNADRPGPLAMVSSSTIGRKPWACTSGWA
jgi:hypothetical protein